MRHGLLALLVAVSVGRASAQPAPPTRPPPPAVQVELARLEGQLLQEQRTSASFAAAKTARALYDLQRKWFGVAAPQTQQTATRLAVAYMGTSDFAAALTIYREQLAAAEQRYGRDSREALNALYAVTSPLWALARWDELDAPLQRILSLTKRFEGERSVLYTGALGSYGSFLWARHEYGAVARIHEQLLALAEVMAKSDDDLVSPLHTIATTTLAMGLQQKAFAYYDRELKILDRSKQAPRVVASWLWAMSTQYAAAGREDLALPLRQRVIDLYTKEIQRLAKTPDDPLYVGTLGQLGMTYRMAGDPANAEKYLELAVTLEAKLPFASWLSTLADVKRVVGKPMEAVALFEKAKLQLAVINPFSASMYNLQIADALREAGEVKRAGVLVTEQLTALEKQLGKSHPTYALAELTAAYIAMTDKAFDKAEMYLTHSLDIAERELQRVLASGIEADHALYFQRDAYQLDTAINYQIGYAPTSPSAARLGLLTLLRRKGRVLDAAAGNLASIRGRLSAADKQLLDDLAAVRAKLATLTVAGPTATGNASYVKEVAALEEQVARLEVAVGSKSAAYRARTQPITLERVQRALPRAAKLVEIASFIPYDPKIPQRSFVTRPPREYAAYVLGPKGAPTMIRLGPVATIDAAVAQFRRALADPKDQTVIAKGRAVYDLTIAKLAPAIGTTTEVLIAPDAGLNVVPFSALVDTQGKFLLERYNFTYLTSGRDLLRLAIKTKAQGGGVMFADPAFDAAGKAVKATAPTRGMRSSELGSLVWPPLPGTGKEADGVEKQMKLTVYRHDQATEGTLKKVHGPRVLHLATHGFFLPDEPPRVAPATSVAPAPSLPATTNTQENPLLRSGLALAGANALSSGDDDGILTAMEASGLDLWGTKLVVLSACETGVGKVTNGDGVYGLRRALVIAGAESLVMSLWQVDDEATKELMVGFYQRLGANKPRSSALRETQLELSHRPAYAHPFYWASFVPAGSNEPLD